MEMILIKMHRFTSSLLQLNSSFWTKGRSGFYFFGCKQWHLCVTLSVEFSKERWTSGNNYGQPSIFLTHWAGAQEGHI